MSKRITADRPLGTQAVSRIAKVAPRTVARWIDNGLLPGWSVPGGSNHRRVMPRDLIRFLREARMPVPPDLAAVEADSASPDASARG